MAIERRRVDHVDDPAADPTTLQRDDRCGCDARPHAGGNAMTHASYDAIVIGSRPGRAVPRRPAGPGRHEAPRWSSASTSAAPASTTAASRPRRWSPAPAPRTSRARAADYGVHDRRAGPRRHEGGQGAQGPRRRAVGRGPDEVAARDAEPDARLGPRALQRRRTRSSVGGRRLDGAADLHQRRRPPAACPTWPGIADVPVLTNTLDDGRSTRCPST